MKTKKEIQKKIKQLLTERKKLPRQSIFGDKNWEKIDAQVKLLSKALRSNEFDLADKLDLITERYDRDFPPENHIDRWESDALDWLLKDVDLT